MGSGVHVYVSGCVHVYVSGCGHMCVFICLHERLQAPALSGRMRANTCLCGLTLVSQFEACEAPLRTLLLSCQQLGPSDWQN